MADASLSFIPNTPEPQRWLKCCSTYYTNQSCSNGDQCPYLHHTPQEVIPIHGARHLEYFMGMTRTSRTCRYYLRGNCPNKDTCPYIHDRALVVQHQRSGDISQAASTSHPTNRAFDNSLMCRPRSINTYDVESIRLGQPNRPAIIEPMPEDRRLDKFDLTQINNQAGSSSSWVNPTSSWVNAPEFVPRIFQTLTEKPKSYAEAVIPSEQRTEPPKRLCPFMSKDGVCRNMMDCNYLHGEVCDMCERSVLHPYDEELRKKHRQECLEQHEKNMELSFAIARSKEKTCGVCFEVIMEKANGEQRFGILPNCNHCFCLVCIRKWRQARQFENKIIRACPECRVTSDFVCPSLYWVDTKEDKDKLIDDYKKALATKDCKYFKKGQGKCPFGNKCFYLHALQDGRKCDVGPPPRRRPPLYSIDFSALDSPEFQEQVMLWDFLNERDAWSWLSDDFDTESDESEWSDIIFD